MFEHQWSEPPRIPHKCYGVIKNEIFNRLVPCSGNTSQLSAVLTKLLNWYDCDYVLIVSGFSVMSWLLIGITYVGLGLWSVLSTSISIMLHKWHDPRPHDVDVEVQGAQANRQLALTASYNWPGLAQANHQLALTASYNWPGLAQGNHQLGVASVDWSTYWSRVACRTLQLIEEYILASTSGQNNLIAFASWGH